MLQGEKEKLKISSINIQSLMCVKSWCFGLEIGYDGKQRCCLLLGLVWHFEFQDHLLLVSGKLQIPSQLYCFNRFASTHANRDCNLMGVLAKEQVKTIFPIVLSRKALLTILSESASNKVSIQHFPQPKQSLGVMPGVEP